jgi:hypothetical protein
MVAIIKWSEQYFKMRILPNLIPLSKPLFPFGCPKYVLEAISQVTRCPMGWIMPPTAPRSSGRV